MPTKQKMQMKKRIWIKKYKKQQINWAGSSFDLEKDYLRKSSGGSNANIQWFDTIYVDGGINDTSISFEEAYKKYKNQKN